MSDYDLSIHTNPDAAAWAVFFKKCRPDVNISEDDIRGWFANAMMAMHDHLHGNPILNGDHAQHLLDKESTHE